MDQGVLDYSACVLCLTHRSYVNTGPPLADFPRNIDALQFSLHKSNSLEASYQQEKHAASVDPETWDPC